MKAGESKYTDELQFVVCVLFLHGLTFAAIARGVHAAGLAPKISRQVVAGIVLRNDFRKSWTLKERQAALDALKECRLDNGRLPDKCFVAKP